MLLRSDLVAKVVLLVLLLFSIASWAIILTKWWSFRRHRRQGRQFLFVFQRADSLGGVLQSAEGLGDTAYLRVFRSALERAGNPGPATAEWEPELLQQILSAEVTRETHRLERYLPFLATAGSVSPFIGLFGTVWGVMKAFLDIGFQSSASIRVVAPGIAEALIATAAGLAVAVPALIFYNQFANQVRVITEELEAFTGELIASLVRERGRP